MTRQLDGKVAVITGGSRGIGSAIAKKLGSLGAHVAFNYKADHESAEALLDHLDSKGTSARAIQADMSHVDDIEKFFATVISEFGHFDILVNNAGIAIYKKMADFSEEDFDRLFTLNVKGLFFCCRQAARDMADNGSIINIGSTVTRVMLPTYAAYAASKGAVEQITKVLAKELGGRGIRVNTLSPGPVDTALFRAGKTEEQIQQLASLAALGRIGEIEDIADAVALLVDEQARWISGQNVLVNGGFAA